MTAGGRRPRGGERAPARPAATAELAILEADPGSAARGAAVGRTLGFWPVFARGAGDLVAPPGRAEGPRVALVGLPSGERALAESADVAGARPVTIASVAGDPGWLWARAEAAGADLVTRVPHTGDRLGPILLAAGRLARERSRARDLEGETAELRERLGEVGGADRVTGFYPFEFFKRVLFMEIKRAKRYGYSLAACLVGLDPAEGEDPEAGPSGAAARRDQVASAISSCIRDIDLPVDVADDRFLVFLPYTDLLGAERVGDRIAATVRYTGAGGGSSVSVGIAALRPGKPVSFARLMRDAGAALRAAQLKGGGRVVTRR